MHEFADIKHELKLIKFSDSSLGTLYYGPYPGRGPEVMVRHFDRDISLELVKPFAELVRAAQQWITHHPELARLVTVEQPSEVGSDFIATPYHMFGQSTRAYVEWEEPPEQPVELEQMRSAFRAAIGKSTDPRDAILEEVLARSLLEPTGKTYFDESKGQFVVVEPKLTRKDVERWAALIAPSRG